MTPATPSKEAGEKAPPPAEPFFSEGVGGAQPVGGLLEMTQTRGAGGASTRPVRCRGSYGP